MPSEASPKSVVVRVKEKGYITNDMVVEWYRLVRLTRMGASLKDYVPNLLMLNFFRGHLTAKVKAELRRERTDMLVIAGGFMGQLQLLC
ncbi:hypothetical protein HPB49_010634 [Dermacentor silvarum]|uniref:Uncharacterized protein n=1 Tax=Dermacentor silvarum TaxID=543639 RepID=A0ACB8CR12_DERSI|nr:hypothetical protein HPB49_010634 [Dermacentor silvarum]